ncbi:MAG: hypothetical protein ABI920_10300 [Casimicrobiaceae bacterium]
MRAIELPSSGALRGSGTHGLVSSWLYIFVLNEPSPGTSPTVPVAGPSNLNATRMLVLQANDKKHYLH